MRRETTEMSRSVSFVDRNSDVSKRNLNHARTGESPEETYNIAVNSHAHGNIGSERQNNDEDDEYNGRAKAASQGTLFLDCRPNSFDSQEGMKDTDPAQANQCLNFNYLGVGKKSKKMIKSMSKSRPISTFRSIAKLRPILNSIKGISVDDTAKTVTFLLDALNETTERFEGLENSVKTIEKHNKQSLNELLRKVTKINAKQQIQLSELMFLLKQDQKLLASTQSMSNGSRGAGISDRENDLREKWNQVVLIVLIATWLSVIQSLPIDYATKVVLCIGSTFLFYYLGTKYVAMKIAVERENRTRVAADQRTRLQEEQKAFDDEMMSVVPPLSSDSDISGINDEVHPSESSEEELDVKPVRSLSYLDSVGMTFNFLEGSGIPFSSVFDPLNDKQKKTFVTLKSLIMKEIHTSPTIDKTKKYDTPDDFNILRFLQADKYELEPALKRLVRTVAWRQTSGVVNFVNSPPAHLAIYKSLRKRYIIGRAYNHQPVVYENVGRFFAQKDVPKALAMESWLKGYAYECSELFNEFRNASIASNQVVHKFIFIGDLKEVSLAMIRKLSMVTTMRKEVEEYFPECAGTLYLVNAPVFATRVWKMVSKVLDPVVVSKIKIFSDVPMKVLLAEMSEEVIPMHLGGKNTFNVD